MSGLSGVWGSVEKHSQIWRGIAARGRDTKRPWSMAFAGSFSANSMSGIDVHAFRRRLRRLNPIVALTNPVNIDSESLAIRGRILPQIPPIHHQSRDLSPESLYFMKD